MRTRYLGLLALFALSFSSALYADSTDRSSEYIQNRVFRSDSYGDGRQTVTTNGTRVQLSTSAQRFGTLTICAETDNTNPVTVGGSTVVGALATRRGVPLDAGDCYTLQATGDLSQVYIDSVTDGEGVSYAYSN